MKAGRRLASGPFVARYYLRRGSGGEIRRQGFLALISESVHSLVGYFHRTSSWHRLKTSVAWLLRYRENLRRFAKRVKPVKSVETVPISSLSLITIDEMECAELEILKSVQKFHFQEELESLNKSKDKRYVKNSSSLRSLDPILMNDLLRVGGRLSLVSTTFGAKHQIILPKNDHVTNLIVEHYHLLSEHSGREFVLSLAREKFWIIQASSVIRRVLSKCVDCQCR